MRDHIINEIQRLAKESGGQAPGQKLFAQETGISEYQWRGKISARWGDALVAGGFEPNNWNERHDSDGVLAGMVDACRHFGRVPTNSEIEILRSTLPTVPSIGVVKRHFG